MLLQTELVLNVINYRVNFPWLVVFSYYLFRAFYFCLLVAKILALEAVKSVMYSPAKHDSEDHHQNHLP